MNLLNWFKVEKRADDNQADDNQLTAFLDTVNKDVSVTEETTMEVPSISGAIDLISNTFAVIPIKLYKNNKMVEDDVRVDLLNKDTGDTLTISEMKASVCRDYLLDGNGYIYIKKSRNIVSSLHYVSHNNVSVMEGTDPIFKTNIFSVNGVEYRDYNFIKLLRHSKNGATGKGLINENKNIISLMIKLMEFEKNQVLLNGLKRGFLESENKLSQEAMDKLKQAWRDLFLGNSGNEAIVLNEGIKFNECSSSPTELQLQESKQQNAKEIYKLLNIPIEMLSGKPTVEIYRIFIRQTIMPICELFEKSLNKNLLLEKEKKEYCFKFDYSEILKGDVEARYETYQKALNSGIMTINEIREKENLETFDDMNVLPLSLGGVYYNVDKKTYYTPNTDTSKKGEEIKNMKEQKK